jgi:prevent-host-death family protein
MVGIASRRIDRYNADDEEDMRMTQVSVAQAKNHLDELLARVAAGERIVIRRRDRPVAVLMNAAELKRLEQLSRAARQSALALGQRPSLLKQIEAGKLHPAMAAFGLWRDENTLDNLAEEIYANRQRQTARAEVQW